jgi:DNA-binding transcriptional ArsR family regulator
VAAAGTSDERLDRALLALADPTRRRLLRRLAAGPRRAGELAEGLPMTRPAVCKHLLLLTRAGLVTVTPVGRTRVYRLAPAGLDPVRRYVHQASRLWETALAAFRRYAEGEGGGR